MQGWLVLGVLDVPEEMLVGWVETKGTHVRLVVGLGDEMQLEEENLVDCGLVRFISEIAVESVQEFAR